MKPPKVFEVRRILEINPWKVNPSLEKRVTYKCDEPGCEMSFLTITDADQLEQFNWAEVDGKDYCPLHAQRPNEDPEETLRASPELQTFLEAINESPDFESTPIARWWDRYDWMMLIALVLMIALVAGYLVWWGANV